MKLTAQQIESIAKEIHEDYRKGNPGSRYDITWESLPEDIRQANRDQAIEFMGYINILGLTVTSDIENPDCIRQLTDEQIETVARQIHEVWIKSKVAAGWRYGPVRDDGKKIHPMLIPYAELSESERDKDRVIARSIAAILKRQKLVLRHT